jgi:hypothetical protein
VSRATRSEPDDPARRQLSHPIGPTRLPYVPQPPTPAILEILVGHLGEEALRDDASVSAPPRVDMDTRDSASVFLPSLSDLCGRHCSPMVISRPPWYPRKGKYYLSALSRGPTGELPRTCLPRTPVNKGKNKRKAAVSLHWEP